MKSVKKEYDAARYKEQKEYMRWNHIEKTYGLSKEEWMDMFNAQGGCCALCGTHQKEFKNALHTDHCHETGRIRGLLCIRCNSALGTLGDNKESLKKVMDYLS